MTRESSPPEDSPPPPSRLLNTHDELDQLMLRHQAALLERDIEKSARLLDEFAALLEDHMRAEDEVALPAYSKLGHAPRGGGTELFEFEHRKLAAVVRELIRDMATLSARKSVQPRHILALLDRETSFKHLLEHHDARERGFLYARLDEELDSSGRRRFWSALEGLERPREVRG